MTGLSRVAAAAAFLAIGFLPNGDCLKGPAAASTVLESLPVALTQTQKHRTFEEIPCRVLQLTGSLPSSECVKLTGSGWSKGPLEFVVSQQGGEAPDQGGDAAVGTPRFKLSIHPPEEGDEKQEPLAGKAFLTEYTSGFSDKASVTEMSLPIHSTEFGFMFICSTENEGQKLKCHVSGYDNRHESDGKWETEAVEFPLISGSEDLRFSISGDDVHTQKLYATSGLHHETRGDSLGCEAEHVSADYGGSSHSTEEGIEGDNLEEKMTDGGFSTAAAQEA